MSDRRNSGAEPADKSSENFKYKGVRRRKWGKWVSEIRLPNSRDRIWLGSYDKPEKAARAFDAAQFCLRGPHTKFNFPDSPPDIAGAHRFSAQEIQVAAAKFAADHGGDDQIGGEGGCSSNALAGEHFSAADGGGVWTELDGLGGGSDFGFFDNTIMGVNEMIYDGDIFFAGQKDVEEDEDFCHESNFLWNFDNH